jgi:catechol 2,3-dioxygenase-like lactoylglutathione lyase family enzyme
MPIELNHTIVHAHDPQASAAFLAEILGRKPGRINHHDGGRGVYWNDPDGHYLEIITRPYGSGA